MGLGLILIASLAIAGCQSKAQREQTAAQKQAQKEAKAEAKRQAQLAKQQEAQRQAEAKAQAKASAEQQKVEAQKAKELAAAQQAQAEADAKQREKDAKEAKKRAEAKADEIGHELMIPEEQGRYLDMWFEAQAAAGAYEDQELHNAHFDCGVLNSLGRAKLALLLKGAHHKCATVHITGNVREQQTRVASVEQFWKDSAYSDVKLTVKDGVNEDLLTPSTTSLKGLAKLDKDKPTGPTRNVNITNNNSPAGGGSSSGTGGSAAGTGGSGYPSPAQP
jgi:colicin import membrane protein